MGYSNTGDLTGYSAGYARSVRQGAIQQAIHRSKKECYKQATMRVRNSLRSAAKRDRDCRIVRRKRRLYVINKKNPRLKARQG